MVNINTYWASDHRQSSSSLPQNLWNIRFTKILYFVLVAENSIFRWHWSDYSRVAIPDSRNCKRWKGTSFKHFYRILSLINGTVSELPSRDRRTRTRVCVRVRVRTKNFGQNLEHVCPNPCPSPWFGHDFGHVCPPISASDWDFRFWSTLRTRYKTRLKNSESPRLRLF